MNTLKKGTFITCGSGLLDTRYVIKDCTESRQKAALIYPFKVNPNNNVIDSNAPPGFYNLVTDEELKKQFKAKLRKNDLVIYNKYFGKLNYNE